MCMLSVLCTRSSHHPALLQFFRNKNQCQKAMSPAEACCQTSGFVRSRVLICLRGYHMSTQYLFLLVELLRSAPISHGHIGLLLSDSGHFCQTLMPGYIYGKPSAIGCHISCCLFHTLLFLWTSEQIPQWLLCFAFLFIVPSVSCSLRHWSLQCTLPLVPYSIFKFH